MTDRERIRIAKVDMFKLQNVSSQLIKAYEVKEQLITSLYGTGIDYSKDHVQTSPVNAMEEVFSRICDVESKIDSLIDTRRAYLEKIYRLKKDQGVNILIDKYVHLKSFRTIAAEQNKPVMTIHDIHDTSLIEYFYTNCCINLDSVHQI